MKRYLGKAQYWWFCAKPTIFNVSEWKNGTIQEHSWYNELGHKRRVFCNFLNVKIGDITVFYESTPTMAVVALAEVVDIVPGKSLFFKKIANVKPITYKSIKNCQDLSNLEFLRSPNGSFFKLSSSEFEVLSSLTYIIT